MRGNPDKQLSIMEEKFVQNVLSGSFKTQGDAWADAYGKPDASDQKQRKSYSIYSAKVMARPHVKARIKQLRSKIDELMAENAIVTIETITAELDENRAFAQSVEQAASMNAATVAKAKLHGLMRDKVDHTSSDGSMTPTVIKLVSPNE